MKLLRHGDAIAPGMYKLHSAFDTAVNFERNGSIVSAVLPEPDGAGAGPVNMVFDDIEPLKTAAGLAVTPDSFAFPSGIFRREADSRYNSALILPGGGFRRITQSLPLIKKTLLECAPGKSLAVLLDPGREHNFTAAFDAAFLARAKENLAAGNLAGFKGLGAGLTPAGDDFITGVLCGLGAAAAGGTPNTVRRSEILKSALGGNPLSNTFLRCAAQGRYFARFKTMLETAAEEDAAALAPLVQAAVNFGNTSGADTLAGLVCYFEGRFK
ncbi:MAG: DUF2877 domain-containing protein [Elusimicrobiaceae bacterium]|nr:DUF2877 domain-containing protein [Elusimicrobiaceae bacterium]